VILRRGVAVCLLLSVHCVVIFAIAQLSYIVMHSYCFAHFLPSNDINGVVWLM